MSSKRLGIFGGAFDPIHVGHLFVASAVMAEAKLEQTLFMPVGEPAHRTAHAPAADRKTMVALGIKDNSGFALDETALHQPGPVYTADTMPLLRQAYPDVEFDFIAGVDSLVTSVWRRLDEVVTALRRFYVVAREGTDAKALQPTLSALPSELAQRFVFLNLPLIDVSASVIRERVAQRKPIRYLVPDAVEQYIEDKRLYRNEKRI